MRNKKDFLDAIEMMAMEAAKKDAQARRNAEEAARRRREDEIAELEARKQEEAAAQREVEAAILSTASQMLGEVLEALEEASAAGEEMDCEECPHKETCDTYNENYEDDDCYEDDDEDYYEEDDLYDENGCDCEEEEMQPRAHMFRSPFPFLMPGQVPVGAMVAGPFPENEEEAKELQRLIRKGALAEAKEDGSEEDAVAVIISNFRKLNSKEKGQVLTALRAFM